MRKLPPLTALRAFEAAARHRSFKAAADELGVTPTAISHQMQLLEAFCGARLFRRRPLPVQLTEAGASLYPAVRDGLDRFAEGVSALTKGEAPQTLVVTTTNAFASKWLVPRLSGWRKARPDVAMEVIGTDAVLDLEKAEADVAIRYMPAPPADLVVRELFRDEFIAVCRPDLLPGGKPLATVSALSGRTLIHCYWSPSQPEAPTWRHYLERAAAHYREAPELSGAEHLTLREELHAIDAAIGGQGILVISNVLIARDLADGRLVKALEFTLPGYGFYLSHAPGHPRKALIDDFAAWMKKEAQAADGQARPPRAAGISGGNF